MTTKRFLLLFLFPLLLSLRAAAFQEIAIQVKDLPVQNGVAYKKIWLSAAQEPVVQLSNATYRPLAHFVPDSTIHPGEVSDFKLRLGMERKQPFAYVSIPVYRQTPAGWEVLVSCTLSVYEAPATALTSQKPAAATNSVLATGSWYKLSIDKRGVYKVDYSFVVSKTGHSGPINSSSIRLFGNGGVMLPESNATPRPDDLVENFIDMHDGGDGVFNEGDYFIFYANGPTGWVKDSSNQKFSSRKNLYADKSYYFLNLDGSGGQRVPTQAGAPAPNVTVTDYNAYAVHELDEENPGTFGKIWWGDAMGSGPGLSTTKSIAFNFPPLTDSIKATAHLGVRSPAGSNTLNVTCNGAPWGSFTFGGVPMTEGTNPLIDKTVSAGFPGSGTTVSFDFSFASGAIEAKAYIDYLLVNTRSQLRFSNGFLDFRDWRSVGPGKVAGFQLQDANGNVQVWDVSNPLQPVRMNGALSGSTYAFSNEAESLHEYIAFDGSNAPAPAYIGLVPNQNLHGHEQVDLIIVTAPEFLSAAEALAQFHRNYDGSRVLCATTTQVYNEFSSGGQDISAIRDFVRMFYKRAGTDTTQMPRNVLLFGDASYDYKDRLPNNTNYVPTFESQQSVAFGASFTTDDFFVLLDDSEFIEGTLGINALDAGIGRLPVHSPEDAAAVVNKIKVYASPASLGPWRLANTYVGDNEDGAGTHLADVETMYAAVNAEAPIFNSYKVYLDAMNFISTPGGARCPDANKAINDRIEKGTFLVNYLGHGNPEVLAHERIVTATDYNSWDNLTKLPFMVTATCDFSRFNQPAYTSAGEAIITKANGGAIAMLTTTHEVYASGNTPLNKRFLQDFFQQRADGRWNTFGESYRASKNQLFATASALNTLRFTLLGDPALQPAFPEYFVHTDSLRSLYTGHADDTLRALGGYTLSGSVRDADDNPLGDFNGRVYVTIYDKPRNVSLITKVTGVNRNYKVLDNVVYKGTATVSNGQFHVSFIAPKDINYDFGSARISYYAENGITDAAGVDTTLVIGGFSDEAATDNEPPVVQPFIGDTTFQDGGITGANTVLFVKLFDESGINVTGSSVGHDLTAVLDGDVANPYILNDYYETLPNTYKAGVVNFPINNLPDGHHTLTVKAWDVYNNSGEGSIRFEVVNGSVVAIQELGIYPNPFGDQTRFVFRHNHPNEVVKAEIYIYSTDGRLVRQLVANPKLDVAQSQELVWDGTGSHGEKLPPGVYLCRLVLTTGKGSKGSAYQKAVLLR